MRIECDGISGHANAKDESGLNGLARADLNLGPKSIHACHSNPWSAAIAESGCALTANASAVLFMCANILCATIPVEKRNRGSLQKNY